MSGVLSTLRLQAVEYRNYNTEVFRASPSSKTQLMTLVKHSPDYTYCYLWTQSPKLRSSLTSPTNIHHYQQQQLLLSFLLSSKLTLT